MEKQSKKKGFTLVELLVVIAILAILASVSVVGYLGFTNKAKQSADETAVTQMNTILEADEVINGKATDIEYVVTLLIDNGFNGDFVTYSSDYQLGWDSKNNRIVICEGTNVIYPSQYSQQDFDNEQVLSLKPSVKSKDEFLDRINSSMDNDVIVLSANISLDDSLIIKNDVTIIGFGTSVISKKSISIINNANVTFKNLNFSNPTNLTQNASLIYASNYSGNLTIEECGFYNTQWDSIQITPENGASIIINKCTFENETENSERYVHIQCVSSTDGSVDCKIQVTNNYFGTGEKVNNSIIDIDYIDYREDVIAYGNKFADSVVSDGDIYICKTATDIMDYDEAYEFMTKNN